MRDGPSVDALQVEPEQVASTGGPLTFVEERFHRRFRAHGGNRDVGTLNLVLVGPLEHERLRQALERLVHRNAVLRSLYCLDDVGLTRKVASPRSFDLPFQDLSGLPEPQRLESLAEMLGRARSHTWDLGHETPLLKAELFRLAPDRHALTLLQYHITFDEDSWGLMSAELAELYRAERSGPALPPPPLQYSDFAAWQRRHFQGHALAEGRAWYEEQTRDGAALSRVLPTDFPRDRVDAVRAAEHLTLMPEVVANIRLDAQLSTTIEQAALAVRAVTPAFYLAALGAVVGRRANAEHLLISAVTTSRNRVRGTKEMLGNFLSSTPVKLEVLNRSKFVDTARRINDSLREALSHSEFPCVPLVHPQLSDVQRSQFNFLRDRNDKPSHWDDLEVERLNLSPRKPRSAPSPGILLDIYFEVKVHASGASMVLRMNGSLWSAPTAQQVLAEVAAMVVEAARRPTATLEETWSVVEPRLAPG